jgi:hypothetical protein
MTVYNAVSFIERAKESVHSSKPHRAEVYLDLALECLNADSQKPIINQSQQDFKLKPAAFKRDVASGKDIHILICRYLRTLDIKTSFTFGSVADRIELTEGIILDRSYRESERRETWRKHVSKSLEKLRNNGHLEKGTKNTEYVLVRYP